MKLNISPSTRRSVNRTVKPSIHQTIRSVVLWPGSRLFALFIFVLQIGGCDGFGPSGLTFTEIASPAGSNSQSPRLSQDANGNPLLSWIESEGGYAILKYSTMAQGRWSPPQEVARGDDWVLNGADTPSVVQLSNSLLAAHWLVENPAAPYAYDILVSHSLNHGKTWSKPLTPHTDGTATEHGFVNLYKGENDQSYGVVWLDGRNTSMQSPAGHGHSMSGVALRSAIIGIDGSVYDQQVVDDLVCDCCPTALTHGPQGPVVAYRNRDETEQRDIFYAQLREGQWSLPSSVGFDDWHITGCPVNGPAIASSNDTVAVAWFTAAGGRKSVRLAVSRDGGQTFGLPIEVDHGDVGGRVSLAMDRAKQITVSWLTAPVTNVPAQIRLATFSLAGKTLARVSQTSVALETKKPNGTPVIAALGNGAGILVWTGGSVRAPKVRVVRWASGLTKK